MIEWMTKTCNARSCRTSRIWGAASRRAGWGGYTLRVVREVRWVFNRRLKMSNVFDSLIAAGNSFQIVAAEKLKERLPTLSVCPDVCLSHCSFNLFLFFVSRWNRAIFWSSVFHVALYKTLFWDFWFRPPNIQNLLPKICTKSPISRLVWQIDRRCLGLWYEIWYRRGDPVTYQLICVYFCVLCCRMVNKVCYDWL